MIILSTSGFYCFPKSTTLSGIKLVSSALIFITFLCHSVFIMFIYVVDALVSDGLQFDLNVALWYNSAQLRWDRRDNMPKKKIVSIIGQQIQQYNTGKLVTLLAALHNITVEQFKPQISGYKYPQVVELADKTKSNITWQVMPPIRAFSITDAYEQVKNADVVLLVLSAEHNESNFFNTTKPSLNYLKANKPKVPVIVVFDVENKQPDDKLFTDMIDFLKTQDYFKRKPLYIHYVSSTTECGVDFLKQVVAEYAHNPKRDLIAVHKAANKKVKDPMFVAWEIEWQDARNKKDINDPFGMKWGLFWGSTTTMPQVTQHAEKKPESNTAKSLKKQITKQMK